MFPPRFSVALIRASSPGVAEEYAVPFTDRVPADPTYEQMRAVVCDQRQRPPMSERWRTHSGLARVSALIEEGWHADHRVRLSILRVKKTLGRIREEMQPNPLQLAPPSTSSESSMRFSTSPADFAAPSSSCYSPARLGSSASRV